VSSLDLTVTADEVRSSTAAMRAAVRDIAAAAGPPTFQHRAEKHEFLVASPSES